MANPILAQKKDKSVADAIKTAFKDGKFTVEDLGPLLKAALDGNVVSDVEYRDLKRFMRTESRLGVHHRLSIEWFLAIHYPLEGPFTFPGDVALLEGGTPLGNQACAALVQHSQPIGMAVTWREGIAVRDNDHLIAKGTALATFEDGFYPNRKTGNHVAYYISQDARGITVMDQFEGKDEISSRVMLFKGKKSNGLFHDPSNNGDALSVIMKKMSKRK
jgi:hypothetical protein